MNAYFGTAPGRILAEDGYEPAAEWLGGEAWVNCAPFRAELSVAMRNAHAEQVATDWIPV